MRKAKEGYGKQRIVVSEEISASMIFFRKSLNYFLRFLLLSFAFCYLPLTNLFAADIYIQLQRGEKVVIGFPDFVSKTGTEQENAITKELQAVTKDDILFTRLFNLVQEGPAIGTGKIDFSGWEKAGSDLLVTANINLKEGAGKKGEGLVQMIASVYEIPSGNPVFQKSYRTNLKNSRRLAHEFVADFLFRFTANRGISQSRIVFSNDSTGNKELYLIDYDGAHLRRLTSDKSLTLLSRWSPDGNDIIYTSYRHGNPDLFIYNLSQGKSKPLSVRKGLNTAASYSPDGKYIAITLSQGGAPNLYLLDCQGKIVRRLTKVKAADTSPSFSPDSRKIVFASDRPGWPQIYMMDVDGSNLQRITETGYCDAPVWSSKGDKIAYSRGTAKGKHDIVIHDLASGQILQVTDNAGSNENPSFSPDGRYLIFTSTRNKKRELYIASVEGTIQKKLAEIPGNCYTPSWGP